MTPKPRFVPALLLVLGALASSGRAVAADIPQRLALEVDLPGLKDGRWPKALTHAALWPLLEGTGKYEPGSQLAVSESVARRVVTHLVPQLEQQGYVVVRVRNAQDAIESKNYNASVRIHVEANEFVVAHDALRYDERVVAHTSTGVSVKGRYTVRGGQKHRLIGSGRIPVLESQVHESPAGGQPMVDDEEAVARLLADDFAKGISDLLREPAGE